MITLRLHRQLQTGQRAHIRTSAKPESSCREIDKALNLPQLPGRCLNFIKTTKSVVQKKISYSVAYKTTSSASDQEMIRIESLLNSRPRKTLGFRPPIEALLWFQEHQRAALQIS